MKSTQRTSFAELEVVKLGRGEWRVAPAEEPTRVLGFIERQRGGTYEIVWMSDPMRWAYADSFDDALIAFGDATRFTGELHGERVRTRGRDAPSRVTSRPAPTTHRTTWVTPGDASDEP